jgi:hypothetical protein
MRRKHRAPFLVFRLGLGAQKFGFALRQVYFICAAILTPEADMRESL